MRKICVVITARASYARVKSVIKEIASRKDLELMLAVTSSGLLQKLGDVAGYIENEGLRIDRKIAVNFGENDLASSVRVTAAGMLGLVDFFAENRPDIVVTVADRYETMATAIAASYMNIPLAHIQGGEVTGNIDERVRHAITKLADLHFVSTKGARQRVLRLGEREQHVFLTGCPSIDLVRDMLFRNSGKPAIPGKSETSEFDNAGRFLMVLQHPVTTHYELSRLHIEVTLAAVKHAGIPAICYVPNADPGSRGTIEGIEAFRKANPEISISFSKPLPPEQFLEAIGRCSCLVGNSSVGIREASFMGVPVVNIGARQDGRERAGNVADVAHDQVAISKAIVGQITQGRYSRSCLYGRGDAGKQIAEILATVPLPRLKRITY